jgi:hypothetical protein
VVDVIEVTVPSQIAGVEVTIPGPPIAVTVGVPGIPGPPGGNINPEDIAEYFENNPILASSVEWGDDPRPTLIFENGLI